MIASVSICRDVPRFRTVVATTDRRCSITVCKGLICRSFCIDHGLIVVAIFGGILSEWWLVPTTVSTSLYMIAFLNSRKGEGVACRL